MTFRDLSVAFKWVTVSLFLILVGFNALIVWFVVDQNNRFYSAHKNIANTTVNIVSKEINEFIDGKQYLVNIFAEDHASKIDELAQDPENDVLKDNLGKRIQRALPESFAFTLANAHGEPILDDFSGNIGKICISDMQLFLESHQKRIRIHPNVNLYHFDLISQWKWNQNSGIFFVNFKAEQIASILQATSPSGHELIIVDKSRDYFIEIFEQGPRNVIIREDYRMSLKNKKRILAEFAIPNTQWTLLDMNESDLFSSHDADVYLRLGLVATGFNLFFIVIFSVLTYVEIRRYKSENFKDEMFSLFSHDLRSPLVSILGGMGILAKDEALSDDNRKLVHLVEDNAKVLHNIVNDILDIQKLESNMIEYNFCHQDIHQISRNATQLNQAYSDKFNVNIEFICKEGSVIVDCDEQRITQVLTNLITNAVKFSPKDETVIIEVKREDDGVTILVKDKGPGIPKEFQARVFEKFAQSRQGNVHSVGGSGLGLAIVKNIILAHKGHVHFRTESGVGTTFIITLPAK